MYWFWYFIDDWDDLIAQFAELSGGLEGGADPPAFQRAENVRLDAAKRAKEADVVAATLCESQSCDVEDNIMDPGKVIFLNPEHILTHAS